MKKYRLGFAVLCLVALLFSLSEFRAAAQEANFVGAWDMTVTGGGSGGGQAGGQGMVRRRTPWRSRPAIPHHYERR